MQESIVFLVRVGLQCRRKESSRSLSHLLMSFLLYHFNREEILHATMIKSVTSPDLCAHLTWKTKNLHFCRGS